MKVLWLPGFDWQGILVMSHIFNSGISHGWLGRGCECIVLLGGYFDESVGFSWEPGITWSAVHRAQSQGVGWWEAVLVNWSLNAPLLPSYVDVSLMLDAGVGGHMETRLSGQWRRYWLNLTWLAEEVKRLEGLPGGGLNLVSSGSPNGGRSSEVQDGRMSSYISWPSGPAWVIVGLCFWAEHSHCSCYPLGVCFGVWGELSLVPQKWHIFVGQRREGHSGTLTPQSSGGMVGAVGFGSKPLNHSSE